MMLPWVQKIIDLALEEDLGRGDITTSLTTPKSLSVRAVAIARSDLVLSGSDIFKAVITRVDPTVEVEPLVQDGTRATAGDRLIETRGPASSLLQGERVALNFLQRLSGTATLTRKFVDRLPPGSETRITDTRKTTPGLRYLERRAVRHGGGYNHRSDLGGGVLIKENHIAAAGSVAKAVFNCRQRAPHPLKIEVEVENKQELKDAIEAGADVVLLDNMDLSAVRDAVKIAQKRVFIEVSGGITLDNVARLASAGVDAISVGALTHSAPAADISLLIDRR